MRERLRGAFVPGRPLLSMYTTVGFPSLSDTVAICEEFERAGAGMIELGLPYSDPIADGPTIQRANAAALANGVTIPRALEILREVRSRVKIPIVLMGYLNPVLQYGIERFVEEASVGGADGVILPDMPLAEYQKSYKRLFEANDMSFIALVTSETSPERIRAIDEVTDGFIYLVSSAGVTGRSLKVDEARQEYLKRVRAMKLRNPLVVGFGIDGREAFLEVAKYADGAIIASAFLRILFEAADVRRATGDFVRRTLGMETEQ